MKTQNSSLIAYTRRFIGLVSLAFQRLERLSALNQGSPDMKSWVAVIDRAGQDLIRELEFLPPVFTPPSFNIQRIERGSGVVIPDEEAPPSRGPIRFTSHFLELLSEDGKNLAPLLSPAEEEKLVREFSQDRKNANREQFIKKSLALELPADDNAKRGAIISDCALRIKQDNKKSLAPELPTDDSVSVNALVLSEIEEYARQFLGPNPVTPFPSWLAEKRHR